MSKSNSVGTQFKIGTAAVGGLTSVGGIEINADKIDVTALDNSTGYREYLPGFKDTGEVSLEGFLDGADSGQEAMYSALDANTLSNFSIVFPTAINKTWSFSGYVTGFSTSADVGDAIKFEATVTVTGKPTLAATTTV